MNDKSRFTPEALGVSNAFRLTGRQWIGVGLFALAMYLFLPPLWRGLEKFDPGPDYRIPYRMSADYWHFSRYAGLAASRCDTLVFGDSVVWGQYVEPDGTLTHSLNALAGRPRFANMGVDGMQPVPLAGLLEHYAGAVRGKKVLLHCNPLWMSAPRADLQVYDENYQFNHQPLAPQFSPAIPAYRREATQRLGRVVERNLPFNQWTTHLQVAYFGEGDLPQNIPAWTIKRPYENPLAAVTLRLPDDTHRKPEVVLQPWFEQGRAKSDMEWVDLRTSIQWRSFRRAVEVLRSRGNRLFVLVGPFNEHMLTEAGLVKYGALKRGIEEWLRAEKVPFAAPAPVASELYADASHPLARGYELLARQLWESEFFR